MKTIFCRKCLATVVKTRVKTNLMQRLLQLAIQMVVTKVIHPDNEAGNFGHVQSLSFSNHSATPTTLHQHLEESMYKVIRIYGLIFVTGYWKTNQIVTLGLFHFIGYTHTLPILSAISRLGWLVCFSRVSFADHVNP